jgi:hypothetical protein
MSDVQQAEHEGSAVPDPHEVEARDYGWAPKEEFKGPEEKWRPASDYLDWAKKAGRLPKGEFEELKKLGPAIRQENQQLKAQLGEIKDTLSQFVEFSNKAEERAFNKAKAEIEAKIELAAANADPVAARQATQELQALKPEPAKKVAEERPAPQKNFDPEIQDFLAKENWYSAVDSHGTPKNPTLYTFATEVFGELERDKPGMATAERLAETKRRTMEKFPEKFGINPMREGAASVATPSGQAATRKSTKKTYDDLPPEAKKACDKFVKQIPRYTRDKYVAAYDWDN